MIGDDPMAKFRAERALRVERFHERMGAWRMWNQRRLDALAPAVAAALEGMARDQIHAGRDPEITEADIREAEALAASRLRVQKYGRLDHDRGHDQHVTVRAGLGLGPPPTRPNKPVQGRGPVPGADTTPAEESPV